MPVDQSIVLGLYHLASAHPAALPLVWAVAQLGLFILPLPLVGLWLWPGPGELERRRVVLASAATFILALALVQVLDLTHVVYRSRPFVALGFSPLFFHSPDSSFPSDHVLLGMALSGPALFLRPRLGAALSIWALLIGLARVATGIHYPSDVLGSAALALVLAGPGILASSPLQSLLARFLAQARPAAGDVGDNGQGRTPTC